jgi:peptidoglycan/LPS O-acetylase OafA/YrhL
VQDHNNHRLLSLDVGRGIAALCVVLFHWSHFFMVGSSDGSVSIARSGYPFYEYLSFAYNRGDRGIDFFFVLSGAIFFIKYADAIAQKRVTAWQFFVLRFSRLYPLHLATLFLAGAFQFALLAKLGHFFGPYKDNDIPHFVLNLFFIQNWGFGGPLFNNITFNAPAWSLSIEVFLYIIFFILMRYAPMNLILLAMIVAFALGFRVDFINDGLRRGIACFFLGGVVARICAQLSSGEEYLWQKKGMFHATTMLVSILFFAGPVFLSPTATYFALILFFALLIGSMILVDDILSVFIGRIAFLGDISYSAYMLHFPLQLAVILVVIVINGAYSFEPFLSPWALLAFFVGLIVISLISFHFFEAPVQKAIRSTFLPKRDRSH